MEISFSILDCIIMSWQDEPIVAFWLPPLKEHSFEDSRSVRSVRGRWSVNMSVLQCPVPFPSLSLQSLGWYRCVLIPLFKWWYSMTIYNLYQCLFRHSVRYVPPSDALSSLSYSLNVLPLFSFVSSFIVLPTFYTFIALCGLSSQLQQSWSLYQQSSSVWLSFPHL